MRRGKRKFLTGILCIVLFMADVMSPAISVSAVNLQQEQENGAEKQIEEDNDEADDISSDSDDLSGGNVGEGASQGEDSNAADNGNDEEKQEEDDKNDEEPGGEYGGENTDGENAEDDNIEDEGEPSETEEVLDEIGESVNADKEFAGSAEERLALMTSEDDIASGFIDEDYGHIAWVIDANGKLTVEGTGDYDDTNSGFAMETPWYLSGKASSIISAEINVSGMTSSFLMFDSCSNLKSVDLNGLETESITDMSAMFYGCTSITTLDLSSFDTRNVKSMWGMFYKCRNLMSVDISSFNTGNVTDMENMFFGCNSLTDLDLSNFDTSNVKTMATMFCGCVKLTDLNVGRFDTKNVTDMKGMFSGCDSLKSLDVSSFNTSNVKDMSYMFSTNILDLDRTAWFTYSTSLTDLDLSNFNTSNVTDMSCMFYCCTSLTNLKMGSFGKGSKVTNMREMFEGCESLTSLDLSTFDTGNVTDMHGMFDDCASLNSLDLSNFDTSNVTDMSNMFCYCTSLTTLNLSSFDTSNVITMDSMFSGCNDLISLDLSNFITSNVMYMGKMFGSSYYGSCSSLTNLDLGNFDTGNVKDMSSMFYGCSSLTSLNLSNFKTENVVNMDYMFCACNSLSELDLSSFNVSGLSSFQSVFSYNLMTIYTPYNLDVPEEVPLPAEEGDIWYRSDGTIVTQLPKNLAHSIVLGRNYIPEEKEDSIGKLINSGTSIFLFRDEMTGKAITSGSVCIGEDFNGRREYYPSEKNGYVEVRLSKDCDQVYFSTRFDQYEKIGGWVELDDYRNDSGIYVFNVKPKTEKYIPKLPSIKTTVDTLGPNVETDEGDISLFNMKMGFALDFGKGIKSNVTFNEITKTIQVAFSAEEKKIDYDAIKDEFKTPENKSLEKQLTDLEDAEIMNPGKLSNVDVNLSVEGYVEFGEDAEFIEGGVTVKVKGSGSTEYRPACTAGLAYAKYEMGISAQGKIKLTYVEGNVSYAVALKLEPYGVIAVGAGWSLAHAEIGATGKMQLEFTFPYINNRESISVNATFELYGEVKFFCVGKKRTTEVVGNIWPATSLSNYTAFNDINHDIASDDLDILSRDYLASNNKNRTYTYNTQNEAKLTSSDSFRYSEISEDKGVFEENNVQYVKLSDGTEVLAWVHDFGDKSSTNRTTLVYSVNKNDGSGWSAITPVCSDTATGDYYPDMAADGNKAYLVWSKASKEFSDDVSIDDICNNMDVYVSIFENGIFSEPQMISDANNGLVEFSPMAAVSGNSAAVAWMTNSVNDYHYTRGENAIYVCEYKDGVWGKPVCYAQNLNYVSDYDMDYVNGSVAVLYAEDADNRSDTQDGCVYYVRNGMKAMVGDATYDAEIVDFCDGMIYFSGGSRVYKAAANNLSYIYDTGIETSNFSALKSVSGNEAVMFLKQDGFESNIYASYYRNGVYTCPVPLVADGSRVTNYSPIYNDDGTISIAYDEEEILENSDYIYGLTDMVIAKDVNPNLFFVDEDLAYNAYDVAPGNTIEFATAASNYTNNAVSKVKVSLSGSSAGVVSTEVLDVDIPVGETKYVSIPYTLPDHIVNQRYTLTVLPVDFDDTDLSDNTAACELGFSDIMLSDLRIDNNTITGKVTNVGYQTAENVSLTIKEDNQENAPLVELPYGKGDLAVGESWEFSQAVEPVEFENVGDVKYYLLSVQTDSLENNYSNDSEIVYSEPLAPTSISLDTNTLSLKEKTAAVIHAEVLPENAAFKEVVYTSSDNSVVIVDNKGNVYAVGKGNAIVTSYTLDGSQSAKCEITVEGLEEEKYVLSERALELEIANEGLLCVKDGNGDSVEGVIWSSTDEDIVMIDQDGTVAAKGKGIAYLVARVNTFVDVCIVRVSDHSILQLACEKTSFQLTIGETAQLDITVIPEDTTMNKTLTYVSDDESVVVVSSSGMITAVAAGSTVITVSSVNGVQKKIEVIVDAPMAYTVTFDTMGGTRVDSVEVTADKIVTEEGNEYIGYLSSIPNTYKEGYSFAGWYTDKNGTGKALSTNTPITGNVIYYAKWLSGGYDDDFEGVLPDDIPVDGIPATFWIAGIDPDGYIFTGKSIKPTVRVYDGNKRLKEGRDYTLSYKNNIKANDALNIKKAPTVTVTGKGNYSGKETATFVILPVNLNDTGVMVEDMTVACNNKLQKKVPSLTYNGKKLSNNKDFTVSYPALEQGIADAYKAAGTYDILLTAKAGGNFTGTRTVKLTITNSILMSKVTVKKVPGQAYTGNAIEPELTVTYKNTPLEKDTDYTVAYTNNTEVGTATAILTGVGDYAGTKKVTFKITGISLKKAKVSGIHDTVYDGTEQKQDSLIVELNNATLEEGTDYEIAYANNANAGKASIIITGKGAYTGTVKKTFRIMAYSLLEDMEVTGDITAKYVKGGSKPEVELVFAGKKLTAGTDYTVSYRNNKAVTTEKTKNMPTITVKGKGNFKGSLTKSFTIISKALNDADSPVTLTVADKAFINKAGKYMSKPTLTDADGKKLALGKDYEKEMIYSLEDGTLLTNKSIVNANVYVKVKVVGKGAYYGELEKTYRITECDFTKAKIKISPKVYTGSQITLNEEDITVKVGNETLIYGTDYEILAESYVNNKNKGTASVTVIGKGNYGGMKISKFKINSKGLVWFWRILQL